MEALGVEPKQLPPMSSATTANSDCLAPGFSSTHRLFPASRRVYIPGSRPDLLVPMREIALSPTRLPNGTEVPNEPIRVYDTSGPWGDASFHGDPALGLPPLRIKWIRERDDVEEVAGRAVQPIDDGYLSEAHRAQAEAEGRRNPIKFFDRAQRPVLRAKAGRVVTQLAPAWTTDWMTPAAREKLRAYGIAPPNGRAAHGHDKIVTFARRAASQPVPCPRCGSAPTTSRSSRLRSPR